MNSFQVLLLDISIPFTDTVVPQLEKHHITFLILWRNAYKQLLVLAPAQGATGWAAFDSFWIRTVCNKHSWTIGSGREVSAEVVIIDFQSVQVGQCHHILRKVASKIILFQSKLIKVAEKAQ